MKTKQPIFNNWILLIIVFIVPVMGWADNKVNVNQPRYEYLNRMSKAQLNSIMQAELEKFSENMWPGFEAPVFMPARYDVDIYRVTYDSWIPEMRNQPTQATGLLAIPVQESEVQSVKLPLVSYQHGTVFGKYEVPSYAFSNEKNQYDGAYETRLNVAQFAGHGYAVIAADYFGMGGSQEPEGYSVKGSHQQACLDLYQNSIKILGEKNIDITHLFIAGWSQGGLVTMQFLEKLEQQGLHVSAASTASAPADAFISLSRLIYNPRTGADGHTADAAWAGTVFILSAFSYENYYAQQGLARKMFKPAYYPAYEKIYNRQYSNVTFTSDEMIVDGIHTPTQVHKMFNSDFMEPQNFSNSDYVKYVKMASAYQTVFKTPLTMFYGQEDEVFSVAVAKLPSYYLSLYSGDNIKGVEVPFANHRGTFLASVFFQKQWFDSLLNPQPVLYFKSPSLPSTPVNLVLFDNLRMSEYCLNHPDICRSKIAKIVSNPKFIYPYSGNPAAHFCTDNGGSNLTLKDEQDNEYAFCDLGNGVLIDGWDLFRRVNNT